MIYRKSIPPSPKGQGEFMKEVEDNLNLPKHWKRVYLMGVRQQYNVADNPIFLERDFGLAFTPGAPQYIKVGISTDVQRRLPEVQGTFNKKPLPKLSAQYDFGKFEKIRIISFGLPTLAAQEIEIQFRETFSNHLFKGKKDWYHGNFGLHIERAQTWLQNKQTELEHLYKIGLFSDDLSPEVIDRLANDSRSNDVSYYESSTI